MEKTKVNPASGKLGILVVGNGAVATTFMTQGPDQAHWLDDAV